MTAVAAPVITAEMADWTALGGGNSGIVGDQNHRSGFHCAANNVPSSDYSRQRDPNGSDGPYVDWDFACAGDFSHKNNSTLRAMHADVLNDLMDGKYPMICEFIGKPWADKPVYYWARWNGIGTLQKYTGQGHDHWSHISWYRSRVDERANLWVGGDMSEMFPVKGEKGNGVQYRQRQLVLLGFSTGNADTQYDGVYGDKMVAAVRAFRAQYGNDGGDKVTPWTALQLELDCAATRAEQGPKGDPGPAGPAGPEGPPGKDGLNVGTTVTITGTGIVADA